MYNAPSVWEGFGPSGVARGFYPEPLEIVLILVFFALLFGLLIGFTLTRTIRDRDRRQQLETRRYRTALQRFNLTPGEERTLETLQRYLPHGESRAELLVSRDLFRYCEERLIRDSPIPPMRTLAALRVKLGFTTYPAGRAIKATSEIPSGMRIAFRNQSDVRFSGILVRVRERDLVVRLVNGEFPPIGASVEAAFTTREGRYAFDTGVVYCEKPHVYLEHAPITEHTQQRKFLRRELFAPVTVQDSGSSGRRFRTTLIEIGGGGCSIVNSEKRLTPGTRVELAIEGEVPFSVLGRVIRMSRNDGVAHLKFEIGREPDRDRLIRYIRQVS